MTGLHTLTIAEIGAKLRAGTLTAGAVVEAGIARHDSYGAALGAYKLWQPDAARATAGAADAVFAAGGDLGPLQGIPVSIKDLFAVDGLPTYSGTPRRLPPEFEREGPVVAAVRRQLAPIPGKTHTVEFAYGGLGVNNHWGTPRNPWDGADHRVSGGSSSGAGVSLIEGSAHLALGSDTAGSVRIPASMTGNVGLKITHGRWPLDGITPLGPSLDTPGVLARTVTDAALGFAALDPATDAEALMAEIGRAELAGLRMGICDDTFWQDCSPGVAEGVEAALDEAVAAGARLVPFELPEGEEVYRLFRRGGIVAAEFYAFLSARLPDWIATLDPVVTARFENAREMPAYEYVNRRHLIERCSASADERLEAVDVVVMPTVAITPPRLAEVSAIEGYKEANLMALRNTSIGNMLTLCALTIPVALDEAGMPVGLQLLARRGHEHRLLAIGRAFERKLGTARERLGVAPLCR